VAVTPLGTSLSSAHQSAQVRLADALVALVAARYRAGATTDATQAAGWIDQVISLILVRHQLSTTLAQQYVTSFGRAEGFRLDFTPERSTLNRDQVRASLYATGVGGVVERLDGGAPLSDAVSQAAKEVAGASMRHALNGGRDLLANVVERDARAIGYARVTREGCCSFCATLASRGAIYKGDSFDASDPRFKDGIVASDHKVHDNCRCFLEPVYSRTAALPGRAEEFNTLWYETTQPFSGAAKLRAFRRGYEALQRGETRQAAIARALRTEIDDPGTIAA
jgi:hypothetical protein